MISCNGARIGRHQQEISRSTASSTSHTLAAFFYFSFRGDEKKGKKNNTLGWMAKGEDKTREKKISDATRQLPYTAHSCCCPPNFF